MGPSYLLAETFSSPMPLTAEGTRRIGFIFLMRQNHSFRHIIPDCHDGGGSDFGEHVPEAADFREEPHADLIHAEPRKRCHDEPECFFLALVLGVEDDGDAEEIIHDEGDGEGNRRGKKIGDTGVFGQIIKETVVQKEAAAADEKKADDFRQSFILHGELRFINDRYFRLLYHFFTVFVLAVV